MRKFVMLIFFPVCAAAQLNWQVVQTSVDTLLWNVHFSDPQHGWAVGDAPVVTRTTNGGADWETIPLPYPHAFGLDVSFYDSRHGCIAGCELEIIGKGWTYRPLLLFSDDGGETWEEFVVSEDFGLYRVFGLFFLPGQPMGWVSVNHRGDDLSEECDIYQTRDGGESWTLVHHREGRWNGALYFTDEKTGYGSWCLIHDNFDPSSIEMTKDGGKTWDVLGEVPGQFVRQMVFDDKGTLWARGSAISRSFDQGASWSSNMSMLYISMLHHRYFSIADDGLMLLTSARLVDGFPAYLFSSSDHGESWQVERTETDQYYNDICVVNYSGTLKYHQHYDIWVACNKGQLLHCKDRFAQIPRASSDAILLEQNYPNPFRRSQGSQILISLKADQSVSMTLFDLQGKTVKVLFRGSMPQGQHIGKIEPSDLARLSSGVYFLEFKSSLDRKVLKMVLLGD